MKRNMMTRNNETSNRLAIQLAFGLSIILSSSLCFAGIYKWTDEQGNVHYGQEKPMNKSAEKMNVQMHAPRDASSYKRPGAKDDSKTPETEKKDETAEKQKKAPETAAEKKRRLAACAQARKNLATMKSSGRVRSKDKDGNTSYLSDEQKQARMKSTQDLVTKHCK